MSATTRRTVGALIGLCLALALALASAGASSASPLAGGTDTVPHTGLEKVTGQDSTAGQAPSPGAEKLTIPDDLVGENAAIAEDELKRLGFTNIEFGSVDEDRRVVLVPANWTVVDISPAPGKEVAADALVVLSCSKRS